MVSPLAELLPHPNRPRTHVPLTRETGGRLRARLGANPRFVRHELTLFGRMRGLTPNGRIGLANVSVSGICRHVSRPYSAELSPGDSTTLTGREPLEFTRFPVAIPP